MAQLQAPALLVGRILLSIIFIMSGWGKITGYAGTVGYMEAMGVPGVLLPLAIVVELGGGLAILVGFQTRIASILLAGFCIVAGYLFHYVAAAAATDPMAQMMQQIMFMKNVTIAGGLLVLFASGAGAWSVDAKVGGKLATA